MEVTNTFVPTAGVVGLLPMVTYFFLVVAMFVFTGNFIFALATQSAIRSELRIIHTLTAVIAVITALFYYLTQAYYHDTLAELATLTDANDRQTLIRESYNAIGQYRYIDWFITAPLLLIQVVFSRIDASKRFVITLLTVASSMFLISYIGHQQLSFDNEIQVGLKVSWGIVATIAYGFVLFALHRLWKQFSEQHDPFEQRIYLPMAFITATCWGIYLIGYFLTVIDIDLNWIHLVFTIADLICKVGVGLVIYLASAKPQKHV